MGARRFGPLSPPTLPPPAAHLVRRLRQRLGRVTPPAGTPAPPPQDPLLAVGRQLREAREAHGLGLRQLALETRISTAVLEALERGWRDRLPEPAYLRTMLPLIERHLDLPPGTLECALPPEKERFHGPRREPLLRRFTPGSIEVFTTWQGTLLYGVITLGLIYALNLEQQQLARRGLLSTTPIAPQSTGAADPDTGAEEGLLRAHPELRPLGRAAAGQALQQLRSEAGGKTGDLSLGVLGLRLESPTRVELRGSPAGDTTLTDVQGDLSLPALPPFRLRLSPPPTAAGVLWNGNPLPAEPGAEAGRYRLPLIPSRAAVPAGTRPSSSPQAPQPTPPRP